MGCPIKPPAEQTAGGESLAWLSSAMAAGTERAIALLDTNPSSATYGCADRAYWNYRTLTNFSGATWQQVMLGLAALDAADPSPDDQGEQPQLTELAGAALGWWSRIQHRDGSFDEWYFNEHSFCPTAITGAGAALSLYLLRDQLPQSGAGAALSALERAGKWLATRDNPDVMNQNVAAAAALHGLAEITGENHWRRSAEAKLTHIRLAQRPEGWLPEYGGADLGYSTLSLDFLAACDALGDSGQAREIASRLIGFLEVVQGAGASLPGRLGSRGTAHQFIYGALHFGRQDQRAARLAQLWLEGLRDGYVANPATVDDRYFAYFYFPQFALAYRELTTGKQPPLPKKALGSAGTTELAESGFLVRRAASGSATVSRRLGGAVALCRDKAVPLYHLGYEVSTAKGERFSSAIWESELVLDRPSHADRLEVAATFRAVSAALPLKYFMVPFQIVAHLLVSGSLAAAFQKAIKGRMISPAAQLPLRLERAIKFTTTGVQVEDRLAPQSDLPRIASLRAASQISMHSPSARQDPGRPVELPQTICESAVSQLNDGYAATFNWSCSYEGDVQIQEEANRDGLA